MMSQETYICLFRKITEWEWYKNNNVKSVFLHCLIKANRFDKAWQGTTIKRGSFVSSYGKMAEELGMSVQEVRTAFKNLEKTGEISHVGTNKYTIFSVLNYDEYQLDRMSPVKEDIPEKPKKETKPKATTDDVDIFFDSVWKLYPRSQYDRKKSVTKKRRQELQKIGFDAISKAIENYKSNQNPNYMHAGHTFFNDIIGNWLEEQQGVTNQVEEKKQRRVRQ